MSTERIKMKKVRDLLRLKFSAKLKHREIGRALNISPATVSYYAQAAIEANLTWPIPEGMNDIELTQTIEQYAKQLKAKKSDFKIKPDFTQVHRELAGKHMTEMLIWEDYAKQHPERHYSYSQFTRLYKDWLKKQRVTMRLEHKAGDKGFVDYAGSTLPILCRKTNEVLFNAQIFVMSLGLSHYTFAYASKSQQLSDWIDAHKQAFQFFGGVPKILVPDNLKSGVTNSCQFEPEANPTYADMAEHYDTAIIPARPRTPQDKSIAENGVLVSSRWIIARLCKQKFYSLNALNNAIRELLEVLNKKPFQKRQGSRYQQFVEFEKPALKPLPSEPYQLATLRYQTVGADYHVRIDRHYYSVPSKYVHDKVLCRYTKNTVEIFINHERIASHQRSYEPDKKTTTNEHMPKAHLAYASWTPQVFIDWANQIGSGVSIIAKQITTSKKHPEQCSKIHFGLKKLCKQFGKERLNQACRRALVLNCVSYKSILSILESGLDKTPHLQEVQQPTANRAHQNLRGPNYYQKS